MLSITNRAEWIALLRERFGIAPFESPCGWPVARIRSVVAREFPQFRGSSFRVMSRGHSLVAGVDGRYIFKFVWHPRSNLKSEIATLKILKGKLGIETPDPVFVGKDYKFFGCPRIAGRKPKQEVIRRWGRKRKAALASELAELCMGVQRAVPLKDRLPIVGHKSGPIDERDIDEIAGRFQAIFSRQKRLVKASSAVFAAFKRRQKRLAPTEQKYIGFDLQFDNLLMDSQGRLAGAVDFGYLTWSDAPGLFGLLYKDDPNWRKWRSGGSSVTLAKRSASSRRKRRDYTACGAISWKYRQTAGTWHPAAGNGWQSHDASAADKWFS